MGEFLFVGSQTTVGLEGFPPHMVRHLTWWNGMSCDKTAHNAPSVNDCDLPVSHQFLAASLRDRFQRTILWCSVTVWMLNVPLCKRMCLNSYPSVSGSVALGGYGTIRWWNPTGGGKSLSRASRILTLFLVYCLLPAPPRSKVSSPSFPHPLLCIHLLPLLTADGPNRADTYFCYWILI